MSASAKRNANAFVGCTAPSEGDAKTEHGKIVGNLDAPRSDEVDVGQGEIGRALRNRGAVVGQGTNAAAALAADPSPPEGRMPNAGPCTCDQDHDG
jgi:hypothetical protein